MAEAKKTTTGNAKTKATKQEPKEEQNAQEEAPQEETTADQESLKQEEEGNPQPVEKPETPIVDGGLPYLDAFGGIRGRHVAAKGVLYTDGLSGNATNNLERAYEYNERLQSNDPAVRESGDESLSESAKALKTEQEKRIAQRVKDGRVGE